VKLVTLDYGCGTSASILDYGIEDVVLVSEDNYDHVYDIEDDLFFIGHDFLFFLWDNHEKVQRWKNHRHRKAVWCFERIDAIVDVWQQKSHYSISMLKQFVDSIYACDEDDIEKYGYEWLPQWASCKFYNMRNEKVVWNQILFSGQAGKPEYNARNNFINNILQDPDLKNSLRLTNTTRKLNWDEYCTNLLQHSAILNPVGILRGFNTRAYEVLYSGRMLLQQTYGNYLRHSRIVENCPNVIMFDSLESLKLQLNSVVNIDSTKFYNNNNIYARFKSIGLEIK
jgi:hypothetical protein